MSALQSLRNIVPGGSPSFRRLRVGMSLLPQWTFEAMCTQRWQRHCAATPATSPIRLKERHILLGVLAPVPHLVTGSTLTRREVDGRRFAYC